MMIPKHFHESYYGFLFLFCYIIGRQELVNIQSDPPQQQEQRGARLALLSFLLGSVFSVIPSKLIPV